MLAVWAVALLAASIAFSATRAHAETRSLKLYYLHTGERAEITFKRNGKYIDSGLKKINRFLRDWRRNEPTKMDPRLLDLIWETYKETGSKNYIHVISGYRSPATNSLLRKRGRGVAKKSQHTMGKALDFFIPGVSLRKLRNIGLRKGLGGVGYYPKSGSPFVHMDTGRVRHWPRMSRKELVSVFPKGDTLHVPTDGKPLARYNQAKAIYERKINGRDRVVVAKAEEIEKKPGLFAKLLGRDDEDDDGAADAVATPKPVQTTVQSASATAPAPKPLSTIPGFETAPEAAPEPSPEPEATPEVALASLPAESLPVPAVSPRTIAVAKAEEPEAPAPELPEPPEQSAIEVAAVLPEEKPVEAPPLTSQVLMQPADTNPGFGDATPGLTAYQRLEQARSTALTPNEIEDLRQQVYATLKSGRPERPTAPTPAVPVGETRNVEIAAARLAPELVEPAASAPANLSDSIVPQSEPVGSPSATEENAPVEVETASLASVAAPLPNPLRQETVDEEIVAAAAPALEEQETVAGLAIPTPALRTGTGVDDQVVVASAPPVEPRARSVSSLERLQSTNLEENMVGKWVLAANTTISQIDDIQPPAYGRNVIRELPSTVLSRGFSRESIERFTQGFSGSSIEFLDFKRFN